MPQQHLRGIVKQPEMRIAIAKLIENRTGHFPLPGIQQIKIGKNKGPGLDVSQLSDFLPLNNPDPVSKYFSPRLQKIPDWKAVTPGDKKIDHDNFSRTIS
ncbi:hypothetical protein QQ054_17000 [Oscillatoria amoena NRMC-F 0135]|nr:hypothetical protein [Oscillatoria amoena NRMC-F 0135]